MRMETEHISALFLELSQFTAAKTKREITLEVDRDKWKGLATEAARLIQVSHPKDIVDHYREVRELVAEIKKAA